MTLYADEIDMAQQELDDAGAPVTFTDPGLVYNDTDGSLTGTAVTATSSALRVRGDPKVLANPNLTLKDPIRLFVAAGNLGSYTPLPDHQMTFAGLTYTVKWVDTLAPDGQAISYYITGSK